MAYQFHRTNQKEQQNFLKMKNIIKTQNCSNLLNELFLLIKYKKKNSFSISIRVGTDCPEFVEAAVVPVGLCHVVQEEHSHLYFSYLLHN